MLRLHFTDNILEILAHLLLMLALSNFFFSSCFFERSNFRGVFFFESLNLGCGISLLIFHLLLYATDFIQVLRIILIYSLVELVLHVFNLIKMCLFLLKSQLVEFCFHIFLQLVFFGKPGIKFPFSLGKFGVGITLLVSHLLFKVPELFSECVYFVDMPLMSWLVLLSILLDLLTDSSQLSLNGDSFIFGLLKGRPLIGKIFLNIL